MIVGPRIIFDKSFIQSLNSALIDEMTLYFTPTCPPTLISEIIADLKLPPLSDGRIGEDIVCQLAEKMMVGDSRLWLVRRGCTRTKTVPS